MSGAVHAFTELENWIKTLDQIGISEAPDSILYRLSYIKKLFIEEGFEWN